MGCGSSSSAATADSNTQFKDDKCQKRKEEFCKKSISLYYFPARGRVEFIRVLLAEAEVPYKRCDIPQDKWPEMKVKEFGGSGLPVLDVGGVRFSQANAIARYIAGQTGLCGCDHLEQAQVDMMADRVEDLVSGAFEAALGGNAETAMKEFLEGKCVDIMKNLEAALKKCGSGYLVGKSITWCDIKLFGILNWLEMEPVKLDIQGSVLKPYPCLLKHYCHVQQLPRIKAYLASRPQTPF